MEFLARLIDTSDFPARWYCGNWSAGHGWLHIASDLAVGGAYFAIPLALGMLLSQRKDLPFRSIFLLFVAFILLCGTTHLMESILFWWPAYRLAGVFKLMTAVVSWFTVFALLRIAPAALAMRSPQELEREVAARRQAEDELRRVNADLELRVSERTRDLVESTEQLRTTLSSIGDGVITTDTQGRITGLNPVAEKLTGWTLTSALGQSMDAVFSIVDEETGRPMENPATRALRERMVVGLEKNCYLIAKDGTQRPIDDSAAPIRSKEGEVIGCVVVFREVTQRRELERQTMERNATARRLAAIVDSSNDAIISKSLEGTILSWNAAAEGLFEYTATEVIGRPIAILFPEDLLDEEERIIARLRAGEGIEHYETERLRRDGSRVHVSLTVSPLRDDEGRVIGASKIVRDISERKRAEEALREADRRKDEFLATLAHELRNPLAPIRNAVQVLRLVGPKKPELEESRDVIERQIDHLVRLVDDLLDISRVGRGKMGLLRAPLNLADVARQAIETSKPLLHSRGHHLAVTLPTSPVRVEGDFTRLTQVLLNLLNNAAKYTDEGGRIGLSVESNGSEAVLRVGDNGRGIEPAALANLFDLFFQVGRDLDRADGGLGIGLSLVKSLVEMHGGKVEAHSEGRGRGSEFVVRLPLMRENVELPASAPSPIDVPACGLRVLVVDDNRDSARSMATLLRLEGHQTLMAHDGRSAVEVALREKPDVVLMDIGLPLLDGYQACRQIRESGCSDALLVAMTGYGQEDDRRLALEAGFDAHQVKPVDLADLRALLALRCPKQ
ncbi:MAG: PAS domain S-box protein [Gemmataceae bacterium]